MSLNILDHPFLQTDEGPISLCEAFKGTTRRLSGDPQKRIIGMKLLLAVAQSALTLKTPKELAALSNESLSAACLSYLDKWRSVFDIDDKVHPFLQFPELQHIKSFNALRGMPGHLAGENTACISSGSLTDRALSDEERIWCVLHAVVFPATGKKWKRVDLDGEPVGRKCERAGALGFNGYLHSFMEGKSLLDTVRLNLLCEADLKDLPVFQNGIGRAPWEDMSVFHHASGEDRYRHTLMGRLVPMTRYVWLGTGLHGAFGLDCVPIEAGGADPSVTLLPVKGGKVPFTALYCSSNDPEWRLALRSIGYFSEKGEVSLTGPKSLHAQECLPRAVNDPAFLGIWAGGRSITFKSGEQLTTHNDVERSITLVLHSPEDVIEKAGALDALAFRFETALSGFYQANGAHKDDAKTLVLTTTETISKSFTTLAEAFFKASTRKDSAAVFERIARFFEEAYTRATRPATGREFAAAAMKKPYFGKIYASSSVEDKETAKE